MRDHIVVKVVMIPDAKKKCKCCGEDGLYSTQIREHVKNCIPVSLQNLKVHVHLKVHTDHQAINLSRPRGNALKSKYACIFKLSEVIKVHC